MMKIYITRHGETKHNKQGIIQGHTDVPLSETGIEQARETARCLFELTREDTIRAVYSSDLTRAVQSARPFIDALAEAGVHPPVRYRKDLREIKLGVWEGKTRAQLKADVGPDGRSLFEKWLENPEKIIPDQAESMPDFFERIKGFLVFLTEEYGRFQGTIVVFTHGGVISMARNFVGGRTPADFIKYSVANSSGVILEYQHGNLVETGGFTCPGSGPDTTEERL